MSGDKASSPKKTPEPRGKMSSLGDIIPPFSRFGCNIWGREGKEGKCACIQQGGRALSNAGTAQIPTAHKGDSHHHSEQCPTWGKTQQEIWFCSVSLLKIHSYLPLCYQLRAVVQVQSSSSHSSPQSCRTQCCSLILTQFPWETWEKLENWSYYSL